MIETSNLTDADIGRRIIWEVGPGIENAGFLAAWSEDVVVIALMQSESKYLKPVEVDAKEVRWAESNSNN